MRVVLPAGVNLTVWKHAVPRNRMRETFTSGSVGGLVEQSLILPGSCQAKSVTLGRGVGTPLKLVFAIQEVGTLPGQRLATSPVVKPVGRRRLRSEAGLNKTVGCVIEPRKLFERCGPIEGEAKVAA